MEWILKNLELILWIAGPIAIWINQRAREKRGQEADYDQDGIPEIAPTIAPPADDVAREARARSIQRGLQRQRQQSQTQPNSPPPPPPPAGYRLASPASPSESPAARQKTRSGSRPKPAASTQLTGPPPLPSQSRRTPHRKSINLLPELRNPEAIRKAIVLREILGPPVALRKDTLQSEYP
jgi:hypothetical protein